MKSMEEELDEWQKKRKDYIAVAVICFMIGMYFLLKVKNESYIIKLSDLNSIENLVVAKNPIFMETKGKRGRRWIQFKCINNKSTFEIAYFDYACANKYEILNEIKKSDTISIKILNTEIENFDNEKTCEIHSLIKNDKEYLNLECRNIVDTKDGERGYILLFSISAMCLIVYSFSKKPEIFNNVSPEIIIGIITIIIFITLQINY